MVYGRPVGISHTGRHANHSDLPSPVDDKFIALGQSQPDANPSKNAFFSWVVKLYHLMDDILESLHHTSPAGKVTPGIQKNPGLNKSCTYCAHSQLTTILQLDALLLGWYNDLPQQLKFSLDGLDDLTALPYIFQRQRSVLKTRFIGMRILLHRQSILFLLQSSQTRQWPRNTSRKWPPLFSDTSVAALNTGQNTGCPTREYSPFTETQLARISANICVQMAQLQIEAIDSSRPAGLSGAWWWDFHCQYHRRVLYNC